MLSIAETKIGVNEANLSVKGFSLLLLWVLSLSFRSEEIIIPSIAMLMSLFILFIYLFIYFHFYSLQKKVFLSHIYILLHK